MANHQALTLLIPSGVAIVACLVAGACAYHSSVSNSTSMGASTVVGSPPPVDSIAGERDRMVQQVLASITGHETQPAESVFKNIRTLNTVPARQLLAIMNQGYARSLGVSCSHCHVVGRWESDEKPEKQIARDMIQMVATINTQLLANIRDLKRPQPIVNCTTCHRGQIKPALNLP